MDEKNMKSLKTGHMPFPDDLKKDIINGEKTTTTRPNLDVIKSGKIFEAVDFEEKTFAKIKITDIKQLENGYLLLTFEVV